jgi:hypothetical protein
MSDINPEDIPDDISEAAKAALEKIFGGLDDVTHDDWKIVANAILDERNHCLSSRSAEAGKPVVNAQAPQQYRAIHDAATFAYEANTPPDFRYSASALRKAVDAALAAFSTLSTPADSEPTIKAAQITMGRGLVDVTRIEHEGHVGILFRPRAEHIPVGEDGELKAGEYWPVDGDVVIWIENEGGAKVVYDHLSPFLAAPVADSEPVSVSDRELVPWTEELLLRKRVDASGLSVRILPALLTVSHVSTPADIEPVAYACEADIRALTENGADVSLSSAPLPRYGMRMALYAAPVAGREPVSVPEGDANEARDTLIALEICDAVMKWMIERGALDIDTEYQPTEIVALLDDLVGGPTALDALRVIASLPTGDNLDVMQGQEEGYRAVERLFSSPPHIETTTAPQPNPSKVAEGWQEAARIGDTVLGWMVKYDLLDAGNEYRAEDVVAVLNDFTPSDATAELKQLRDENAKFREALTKIAERADDNLPMYTPGAMVHTAEAALAAQGEKP